MYLNNLFSTIGFKGNLGSDVIFLIVFLLVSFAVSFVMGKHRLLVSLLGVYVAYAVTNLAKSDFIKDSNTRVLLFLAVLVGFILLFARIIRASVSGSGPALIVKMVIGAAIVIGLSLSIILGWYGAKDFENFISPNVRLYFTADLYKFLWAIAPLAYLIVVRKRMG